MQRKYRQHTLLTTLFDKQTDYYSNHSENSRNHVYH